MKGGGSGGGGKEQRRAQRGIPRDGSQKKEMSKEIVKQLRPKKRSRKRKRKKKRKNRTHKELFLVCPQFTKEVGPEIVMNLRLKRKEHPTERRERKKEKKEKQTIVYFVPNDVFFVPFVCFFGPAVGVSGLGFGVRNLHARAGVSAPSIKWSGGPDTQAARADLYSHPDHPQQNFRVQGYCTTTPLSRRLATVTALCRSPPSLFLYLTRKPLNMSQSCKPQGRSSRVRPSRGRSSEGR